MNKTEVIEKVSQLSGVEASDCTKVLNALEQVLNNELEASGSIRNFVGKLYKLLSILKK
ncbi:MAG: HU family DNA-binding protein [Dysgonomonas sp.]|nr:HU family DNA-binding protein [Dysgonomonas sp.]